MESNPPEYGSNAVYGISPEIDGWIQGDVSSDSVKSPPDFLMQKAKSHISKMAPTLTIKALEKASCSRICDDWFGLTEMTRGIGLISLPFSIIGDILKAPVYLVRATVATVQSALGSIGARERFEKAILDMILQSFSLRFESTLMILMRLGIETPDTLYRQFQNGNLNPFLTLTLFFTAFASRLAVQDCICLASGKILPKDQCPAIGLRLFESIHTLKTDLILAGLSSKRTLPEAAALIEAWLPEVIQMLKEPKTCMENAPPHLRRLWTTLRNIQLQISNLPIDESEIRWYNATPVRLAQRSSPRLDGTRSLDEYYFLTLIWYSL